ncbi:hypothetical protein SAMN05443637_102243 [Pseudonocardia thermophila]|jgi:hypothetical protein|uniref:ThuA-like domain-containing protein n=1 Tax=Pseudonocardia thermophila TaxID=1848 RepID=A0A1M6PFU6_PSETH|nr:hypothetical protein [Pseudonocardia thermophila]SHK06772.1 hypothetical protein SAMN05443637_102243 [Pseudonocardia thermophila]
MSTPEIAFIHGGSGSHLTTLNEPALQPYRLRPIYLYDLTPDDLSDVDAVIVADREHPKLLAQHGKTIYGVAERGGVLAVFGQNAAEQWLPGVGWEPRPTNFWWWRTGEDNHMRLQRTDEPIWDYFSERAMIWHHHGVLTPPEGATTLVGVEEDGTMVGATTYYDTVSTAGELFVTTMDPCYHHGAAFMPGASQLLYSTVRWVEHRARALSG